MTKKQQEKAEKAMLAMTEQMILRIEEMREKGTDKFVAPWFEVKSNNYFPQNISGRRYNGVNSFFLALITYGMNYKTPCFCTFKQAQERGWSIRKGAKSAPISFFRMRYFDKETGEEATREDYLSTPLRYFAHPSIAYYSVFNLDQTTADERSPEEYRALCARFSDDSPQITDECSEPHFDRLIEGERWICPINITPQTKAYYDTVHNSITIPSKRLFKQGYSFYTTLAHEMVHSTLPIFKRPTGKIFGDKAYAREELIAELGASIVALRLGFSSYVAEENASYLSNWLEGLREEPRYLLDIVVEVQKAVAVIFDHLGIGEETEE